MLPLAIKKTLVLIFLGSLLLSWDTQAEMGLGFRLGSYEGGGIHAENLRLRFITGENESAVFRLQIERMQLDDVEGELRDIELYCPRVNLSWPHWDCRKGTLVVAKSPWGAQHAVLNMDWQSADSFSLQLKQLHYAGGRISAKLKKIARNWRVQVSARNLLLERLEPLRDFLSEQGVESVKGILMLDADTTFVNQTLQYAAVNANAKKIVYSDSDGLQVGEGIAGSLKVQARKKKDHWLGTVNMQLSEGEFYSDPLYVAFSEQPLDARFTGRMRAMDRIKLTNVSVRLGQEIALQGNADFQFEPFEINQAGINLKVDDLATIYATIQPLLIGSGLDDVLIEGGVDLHAVWDKNELSGIDLQLGNVTLDENSGSFGWEGLKGVMHWHRDEPPLPTELSFSSAHAGQINTGAFQLRAELQGSQGRLLAPVLLPFYQGEIEVGKVQWQKPENQSIALSLSAHVTGVDLRPLSQDLGWPYLSGQLDGEIPLLNYQAGRADLSGGLKIQVFDGELTVGSLTIDGLDTAATVLQTDLNLKGMDLSQLTEAFSFGRIEGRLNGEVSQLQLIDWQPNQFEAHFYTPADDDMPHRISQRAIENLTELGNGVPGVLSGSFLSMFKTFAYDQVDLRIRQQGNTAELGGIPIDGDGYYLVKGAGLPRVDVIGRNRKVAWKDLLARLQSIRFSTPSIQ